jgi:hypothetical protein
MLNNLTAGDHVLKYMIYWWILCLVTRKEKNKK